MLIYPRHLGTTAQFQGSNCTCFALIKIIESLYSLLQAPKLWYRHFHEIIPYITIDVSNAKY